MANSNMISNNGRSVPLSSLNVQSYHNDSPPFTGLAVHHDPTHLVLDDSYNDETTYPYVPPAPVSRTSTPLMSGQSFSNATSGSPTKTQAPLLSSNSATTSNKITPPLSQPSFSSAASGSSSSSSRHNPPGQIDVSKASSSSTDSGIASPPTPPTQPRYMTNSNEYFNTNGSGPRYPNSNGNGEVEAGEADAEAEAERDPAATDSSEFLQNGNSDEYVFPTWRLKTEDLDETKEPIVIVACGSFSPPTYLHLRMFEMAKDEIVEQGKYEILGGYYSPVSDHYKKAGLAPAKDRVRMCELATESTSQWLMVDPWEAGQAQYTRTAVVLNHFDEQINSTYLGGGVVGKDGKKRKVKIMLLAGGDLIESFGVPGVWSEEDLDEILGKFGCLIVERAGSDVWAFLLSHDILYRHRHNVKVVKQLIYNDISSTKVRLFVRRSMSIKYLLPNSVIQYIYDKQLYSSPCVTFRPIVD